MRAIARIIDRIVPPLLLAAGVTLVGAGLLSYGSDDFAPVTAQENLPSVSAPAETSPPSETEPAGTAPPGVATPPGPTTPPPSIPATASPTITVSPSGPTGTPGVTPTASPSPPPGRTGEATRVVVASQNIDLPVIARLQRVQGQGPDRYPPCDVAIFHDAFVQPEEEGTTYIYGHAQAGMFLPLLEESQRRNGEALLGALIEVYTDDDRLYVYRVVRVKRHALDFSIADTEPGEQRVVLQTSEGPLGTLGKLQVAGTLISEVRADHADAHPRARPRPCYPG